VSQNYFYRLRSETSTRVWVNNPTAAEVALSIANGAVGCTTNPSFGGGLLARAPDEIRPDIAAVVATEPDDDRAAELVQKRIVARILPQFQPLHEASGGRLGFVSLQGAPEADTDGDVVAHGALAARSLAANCIPKLPATKPGLEALEVLVAQGHPVLVTEVFSLAQVAEACERYERVASSTGVRPPFFMAPITGIFGDHLRKVAARDGIVIDPTAIQWAGVAFSRAAARLVADRQYSATLVFGGARTTLDLTGLVGARHHATINWSTFAELLALDPPLEATIDLDVPPGVTAALSTAFDDFRRALVIDGLRLDEFEAFGPVRHFRDVFVAGWHKMADAIREQRAAMVATPV
jgi:transaldolase